MSTLNQVLKNAKCNGVNYRAAISGVEVLVSRYTDMGANILVKNIETGEFVCFDSNTVLESISPVTTNKTRLPKCGDKVIVGGVFSDGNLFNNVIGTVVSDTEYAFEDISIKVTDCTLPNDNAIYFRVANACSSKICE